jgi:hypothetical protein
MPLMPFQVKSWSSDIALSSHGAMPQYVFILGIQQRIADFFGRRRPYESR